MTIRTAHSGGATVRWVYGVFIALCVALVVLVHHETVAVDATPAMSASSMSAMDPTTMPGAAHGNHVMPAEGAPTASEPSSPHSADAGGCAAAGMQHCTTAGVGSVQLAVPDETGFSPLVDLREAAAGREPASTVGRAPPDLSVLSQLRI